MLCKASTTHCRAACRTTASSHRAGAAPRMVVLRRAAGDQQAAEAASSTAADATASSSTPAAVREWKSLGSKVIESDVSLKGPEDQKDFWEGEQFDAFGKVVADYFLPGLIVLGVVCGGIAAATYNDGASYFLKGPGSDDSTASIVIAPEVAASFENSGSSSSAAPEVAE